MLKRIAVLLPLLAGCSAIDDLKPQVSPTNAFVGGQAGATSAENSAQQYAPPGGTSFAPGDCGAGTFTDADLDGWPDASTALTWDTCVKESGLGTVTINGSITLADTAAGTRSLDFTANPIAISASIVDVDDGIDLDLTASGSATGTAPSTVVWNSEQSWTGTIENDGETIDVDIDEAIGWTTTYTAASWLPGDPIANGTLTIEGDWSGTVNGDEIDGDVSTGAGLTISAACESKITAGTMTIEWDNGPRDGTLTITWSACNDRSVDVDL